MGAPRQAVLAQAQQSLNADREAQIFRAWPGMQQAAPKQQRTSVEQQVAPTKKGSNGDTHAPQANSYSRSDISEFYKMTSARRFPFSFKGKMIQTPEDARRVETDFTIAASEGRVY